MFSFQDVQYTDIDSFDENKDFTWDKERFRGLPDYIRELQSKGMRMVLILVGIALCQTLLTVDMAALR